MVFIRLLGSSTSFGFHTLASSRSLSFNVSPLGFYRATFSLTGVAITPSRTHVRPRDDVWMERTLTTPAQKTGL